jgi:hypothetical protein
MQGMTRWWVEGWRSAWLLAPRWPAARVGPGLLLALLAAEIALGLVVERLYLTGEARFWWPSLLGGWFSTVLAAGACWVLGTPADDSAAGPSRPDPSALLAMVIAQGTALTLLWGTAFTLLIHGGAMAWVEASPAGRWLAWLLPLAWSLLAVAVLLLRATPPRWARGAAVALLVAGIGLQHWVQPARHWFPADAGQAGAAADGDEAPLPPLALTQTVWEAQPRLLHEALAALTPGRPGRVDVYALTFAPFADEDVFRRESALVAEVMGDRFGAGPGRAVQLVNHRDSAERLPWATPVNLRRAIKRVAERMDRDEDLLFIHLTSHGAKDGRLAAALDPLVLDELQPQQLADWLTEHGVRHAVISISACYSGSWLPALEAPGRLVMTAADAEHTSYGCGRRSHLTFFGRAMFDEQLRATRDFEAAHAQARRVIEQRERKAGKDDGYSNPQIRVGDAVRPVLERMRRELDAAR